MTQVFNQAGEMVSVTLVQAGPCFVTQVKTVEHEGYAAVQLGYLETKKLNKPLRGHLGKDLPNLKHLSEVRVADPSQYSVGQRFDVGIFAPGDRVKVAGTSKGKGFAGVVKRHGFRGGPKTHGQSDRHRAPGSIGSTTTPGRVLKGLRMAGHMGNERVTVRNLQVVMVDTEKNLLGVKGAVSGAPGTLLIVQKLQTAKGQK